MIAPTIKENKTMRRYKYQGPFDEDNQCHLYWNNDIGWVDFGASDTFLECELDELNMPEGTVCLAWLTQDGKSILSYSAMIQQIP